MAWVLTLLLLVSAPDLSQIRKKFVASAADEDIAEELYSSLKSVGESNPKLYAYKGAVKAILAKHAYLPTTKYSYVKEGLNILDRAVVLDSEDIEVRYLRYSVEVNLPDFLGFETHIKADQKQLIDGLIKGNHGLGASMTELIRDFILKNADLDPSTKAKLRKI